LNIHIYRKRIVIIINAWLLLMSRFTLLSWFLFFFLHFYTTTRVNVYTFHILSSLFGLTKIYIRTDHISNIICRKLLMTVMTFDLDDIMHYFCRIFLFNRILLFNIFQVSWRPRYNYWYCPDIELLFNVRVISIDITRTLKHYSKWG